jgi:histidinol-phosphate aminotransferase
MAPYVAGMREEQVRALCEVDYLVKVSSNESPLPPFESAQKAGEQALVDLNRYPEGACSDLRAMLAQRLAVSPEHLVIGNGSNELLILLALATLNPGDEVVYGWPSFIVYPLMCQLTDAKAVEVPLNDAEQFDLDAILAAITPATKLVLLCSPNNPTGTWYSREAFEAFMDAVPDHVLVVVDEAYFEFVTDETYPDALDWFDGIRPLCVFRTFSKIYALAGIRCGYAVMPPDLIAALNKVRAPFNVNSVAQAMAMASLVDEAELDRRILENAQQRDRLEQAFEQLGISYAKSQTNFVWIHASNAQAVFDALLKRGVIVRSFGQGNALRVGVGSPEETTRIIEAFEKLREEDLI